MKYAFYGLGNSEQLNINVPNFEPVFDESHEGILLISPEKEKNNPPHFLGFTAI